MRDVPGLFHRISFRQAAGAFCISILISVLVGAFQMGFRIGQERDRQGEELLRMLTLVSHSASQAAFNLDTQLAERLVTGLMTHPSVGSVRLYDDFGTLLASADHASASEDATAWTRLFDGTSGSESVPLVYERTGQSVGRLEATLDRVAIASRFLKEQIRMIGGEAVKVSAMVFLLALLFYLYLTKPLIRIIDQVSSVDIDHPGRFTIEAPALHRKDELGILTHRFTTLLRAFQRSRNQRDAAEIRIRESQEKYRAIFEQIQDIYFEATVDGILLEVSPSAEHALGYRRDELVGNALPALCSDREQWDSLARLLETGKRVEDLELTLTRKDGSPLSGSLVAVMLHDGLGRPTKSVGSIRDISRRKQMEEQMRVSLREKEILLKEIHHRVKNNLQIISSLLRLQKNLQSHRDPMRLLTESQNRIRTMSLIHEELYRSGDISRVDLSRYVSKLVSSIFSVYRRDSEITYAIDAEELQLGLNDSIPCGMIINELVTNALEHAFTEGCRGEVRVTIRRDGPSVLLGVSDDGAGIGPAESRPDDSLGLQLVDSLVQQLKGSLTLVNSRGTSFTIRFPYREPDAS